MDYQFLKQAVENKVITVVRDAIKSVQGTTFTGTIINSEDL
jgi:hypothetical protein